MSNFFLNKEDAVGCPFCGDHKGGVPTEFGTLRCRSCGGIYVISDWESSNLGEKISLEEQQKKEVIIELKRLLGENKPKKVSVKLLEIFYNSENRECYDETVLLLSRINEIEGLIMKGVIPYSESILYSNQIKLGLLNLINRI